jgi:ribosome-associated protein
LQLALAAARCAAENRGQDVVVLDMRDITPIFDYFVVVTGSSRRQLHAISEEIDHTLEDELDDQRMGIEGYNESHWILLDYGTVVIHLFDQETREYYALEDFWNMAIRVPLPDVSLSNTDVSLSNTGVSLSNTGVSLSNTGDPLPEGDQETDESQEADGSQETDGE